MEKLVVSLLVLFGTALVSFIRTLAGALFGGISGWIVGLVFNESVTLIMNTYIPEFTMFQIGAALGWIGSFFRATLSTNQGKTK